MDSIKPGMFINDRYEIIDKVGSGGMANVYKAKCHRLNRYVAIKVLKSEFSSDTNFIKRFRAEAQSVAGLSHPNIVSVYDVGDDDGLHYIVEIEVQTLSDFLFDGDCHCFAVAHDFRIKALFVVIEQIVKVILHLESTEFNKVVSNLEPLFLSYFPNSFD